MSDTNETRPIHPISNDHKVTALSSDDFFNVQDEVLFVESKQELISILESVLARLEKVEADNHQLTEQINQLNHDIVELQQQVGLESFDEGRSDAKPDNQSGVSPNSADEASLVNIYNRTPKTVKRNAAKVGVIIKEIREDEVLLTIETNQHGYWLVNELYLFPKKPSRYNEYNLPTLEALFICHNVQQCNKHFNLIKPARISPSLSLETSQISPVHTWRLLEKGILEFTETKLSPSSRPIETPSPTPEEISTNSEPEAEKPSPKPNRKNETDFPEGGEFITPDPPKPAPVPEEEAPQLTAQEQELLEMYHCSHHTEFRKTIKATCSLETDQESSEHCLLKANRWGDWYICRYFDVYYVTPSNRLVVDPNTLPQHKNVMNITYSESLYPEEFRLVKPGVVRRNRKAESWEVIEMGVLEINP